MTSAQNTAGEAQDPAEIIDRCYELISFAAQSEPDWPNFRALFAEKAVLALRVFPGDPAISVMTLDEYCIRQMREGLKETGYAETALDRNIRVFGDVAVATVDFQMHFGNEPPVPAIDVFLLARRGGRWLIVSIIGEVTKGPGADPIAEPRSKSKRDN